MTDAVSALRAFNRFHTRVAGVLQPSYMESGMGLTAARLLYEIAQRDDVLAMELQERLGVDTGYVSRLLLQFEKRGWIARGRGEDGRQRPIRLTGEGRRFFEALDARTRAFTEAWLGDLDVTGRAELVQALGTVRALLGDREMDAWRLRTFQPGDLALIASRQSILYARDYGWGRAMEILQGEVTTDFLRQFKPGREQCWVAERAGRMIGAVMLVDGGGEVAKLRLLHVEPDARGMGVGRALVDACIGFAREAGYARMTLWTHTILTSARRIYEAAGFRIAAVDTHDRFGEPVQGETWELPLHPATTPFPAD